MIACKPNFEYGTARLRSQRRAKFDPAIRKIWNLLEIVKEINVKDLAETVELIERYREDIGGGRSILPEEYRQVSDCLKRLDSLCVALDLKNASVTINTAIDWIENHFVEYGFARFHNDGDVARVHFEHIQAAIRTQIGDTRFFALAKDRLDYYDNLEFFGVDAVSKFPSAKFDILESLNCIALERNTAAVFHLMRVAEHGLRALALDRRIVLPKAGILELATWEDIIRQLEDSEDKIKHMPKSLAREQQFVFYHGALMQIRRFKNVWRNNIMHARDDYDRNQAISVFDHVREFMKLLAVRISETAPPLPEVWGASEIL